MKLYHGTDSKFDKFDIDETCDGVVYFTDDQKAASGYGTILKTASVTFINSKEIDYEGDDDSNIYNDIKDAKKEGYDSLIIYNTDDGANEFDQYIAFSNNQIAQG